MREQRGEIPNQKEKPKENPYADAPGPHRQSLEEVKQEVTRGFDPEATTDGMGAVQEALGSEAFMLKDEQVDNPYFWQGVAAELTTEGLFGNQEALALSDEIKSMVNRALNRDGVQTDGADVDFRPYIDQVTQALQHSNVEGMQRVA